MEAKPVLGVIGGSGLYEMPGLENAHTQAVQTPFGSPSAPVVIGNLAGRPVAFLARHGFGHVYSPSEVNYRANIYALKMLGCRQVVSISACGSLREDYAPGNIVIPDQLFDFTRGTRERSFFGGGLVAHIGSAEPYCAELSADVAKACEAAGATVRRGGALVTIEGPRFSTKAESNVFRTWGMSIIGMTACPEAFLAREAEMAYTTMAHVTDYDVWHTTEAPVSVDMVIATLNRNTRVAQEAVRLLVAQLDPERDCACQHALESALITSPAAISAAARQKVDLLVGKYLAQ
jgi:5'-methylthioadenosine phosphorylase